MVINNKIRRVLPNRVWRTYFGGKEIESWRGIANASDGEMPEDWIASVVSARNPGREYIADEGLSKIILDNEETMYLNEYIATAPEEILGRKHYSKYGCNMGVLVKIIDSLNRLTIQVHPDKKFAREVFMSDYGKTEAWYILGGRKVDGEEPYVLLGFKPGVTREKWKRMFDEQDIGAMLDSLHKIRVKPGEVYFIEGGVPHAIGSGCFLMEIQEPTDYTIRVERVTPEGREIPDRLCHQGAGFDKIFDCFHYEEYSFEDMLSKWRIEPQKVYEAKDAEESILIDHKQTDMFEMRRLCVRSRYSTEIGNSFCIAVVINGSGTASTDAGSMKVRQGDYLFIPSAADSVQWTVDPGSTMKVILCFPPRV